MRKIAHIFVAFSEKLNFKMMVLSIFKKMGDLVPASYFSSKVYMYVVPELQKYKIRKAGYSQSTDKITHCSTIEVSTTINWG